MEYEIACDRLCNDITQLLLAGSNKPSLRATYAAARATEDLAAAFHRAAGRSDDRLWSEAVASLDHFLDLCDQPGGEKLSADARTATLRRRECRRAFVRCVENRKLA